MDIGQNDFLCLDAPRGINLDVELEPVLRTLRTEAPESHIQVAVEDLPAYSLPAVNRFTEVLAKLDLGLVLHRFTREHLRFLQSSKIRPRWVQLDSALVASLRDDASGARLHITALSDRLHHYGIQVGLGDISSREDLHMAGESGIDLVEGPAFGEPLRLPQMPKTAILTSEQVASLLEVRSVAPTPIHEPLHSAIPTAL
jgi:EAL domain-containing protein (putative c-di-GMP-specific phosphodiesterase class I)